MYPYGAIGNCHINALVKDCGSIDWLCLPRPDSPPVFGKILDPQGGHFSILSPDGAKGVPRYISNTNILETHFTQKNGAEYKIIDFCPRFEQFGRIYRPPTLIRKVIPIKGSPTIQVDCKPVDGWSKTPLGVTQGNSHIRFQKGQSDDSALRLTTNMPMTYLIDNVSFAFHEPIYFVLTWGSSLESDIRPTVEMFLIQTTDYWRTWVKHCNIPTLFQQEVIRSALALKLHCYEDTGAILASLTCSLPEEVGHERNWDYRFCWLRDAYFSLSAFHNLGHFEEMEGFLKFLLQIAENAKQDGLHPVYKLDSTLPLPELSHDNWTGFDGSKPVRSGNDAATHVQNDVYGEMILCLAPLFFDDRFSSHRTSALESLIGKLANQCIATLGVVDAGVWEFRNAWKVHSFSTLLCWAGIERVERLVKLGKCNFDLEKLTQGKLKAEALLKGSTIAGSVRNSSDDPSFDASLSLLPILRYSDKELSRKTLYEIMENLGMKEGDEPPAFFYRYIKKDDFGNPKTPFLAISFWMASAFAAIGDVKMAHSIIEKTKVSANSLGLYSEHYNSKTKMQLGNFPQAYSHVGLINSAFAVSPPWDQIL
ncbi:MAG: glycoside hydrolase family 15 protein [Oligoflexia bacterium]|nr:glycoside hydrolase family 15 protein [Oligoflexia bacterium]